MRYGRLLTGLLLPVLAAGCGSGNKNVGVQGEVTFEGRAVEKGTIEFVPTEGTAGGYLSSPIANGRYELAAERGLLPTGTYLVRIRGLQKTGKKIADPVRMMGDKLIDEEKNFIPPIYNGESTMKIRVGDLADKRKVDFRLSKSPSAAKLPQ